MTRATDRRALERIAIARVQIVDMLLPEDREPRTRGHDADRSPIEAIARRGRKSCAMW